MLRHGPGVVARAGRCRHPTDLSCIAPITRSVSSSVARGVAAASERGSAPLSPANAPEKKARPFDHRTIGQEQKLFFTHEVSPGTPFMLPHGVRICNKIERVIRDLYRTWDYEEVVSPQIFKAELWKQSGHWENYRDDMFAVEGYKKEVHHRNASCCGGGHHPISSSSKEGGEGEGKGEGAEAFGLKPMNCPGHCVMFASQERSYRDLPIRYAEFSALHRNEPSGSLTGLTRVRRFHQDDAHVFCRPEQIAEEIANMLQMLKSAYGLFGFPKFELVLSTRPDHYLGEAEDWDRAEQGLTSALQESGMKWKLNEADGAFYGPKIDIRLVDASGKRHQTATIQLDFQLPQRFSLQYDDPQASDGGGKVRPVMIHRAILGSMERFLAILIEHTRGMWPFWLSPRQAMVIPVSMQNAEMVEYADRVRQALRLSAEEGEHQVRRRDTHFFHVDVDTSEETLSKKIRRAEVGRFNFICVVGEEEMRNKTVNLRMTRPPDEGEANVPDKPVLKRNMGAWKIDDLRRLFVKLDDNHW